MLIASTLSSEILLPAFLFDFVATLRSSFCLCILLKCLRANHPRTAATKKNDDEPQKHYPKSLVYQRR
jgi:hypothetical protein